MTAPTVYLGWTWQAWKVALEWAADSPNKPALDTLKLAVIRSLSAEGCNNNDELTLTYAFELKLAYVQEHKTND